MEKKAVRSSRETSDNYADTLTVTNEIEVSWSSLQA